MFLPKDKMFCVIATDHTRQIQELLHQTVWVDDAAQICEEAAMDIVIREEGISHLERMKQTLSLKKRQKFLPEGYSVVRAKSHIPRYSVFFKAQNGYLYHGALKKLYTISVVRLPLPAPADRESEMEQHWCIVFNDVLSVLLDKKNNTTQEPADSV